MKMVVVVVVLELVVEDGNVEFGILIKGKHTTGYVHNRLEGYFLCSEI